MLKITILLLVLQSGVMAADYFELPPIKYSATASDEEVSKLARELAEGRWDYPRDALGFLRAVLKKLDIPEESQVLVFSKTSLQNDFISPQNPRALYFSQDAYLGYVPGGVIELIVTDENLGPIFYTVTLPHDDDPPKITRATDSCLQCHATTQTEGVPGMLVRSVAPAPSGHPVLRAGTSITTDASPLSERWGGWYVTGQSDDPHLGNRTIVDNGEPLLKFLAKPQKTLKSLHRRIDTDKYLRPTSDITALLILEHQCRTHNLFTKAMLDYRRQLWFQESLNADLDINDPEGIIYRTCQNHAEDIVRALLFCDETTLGGDGVEGGEAFADVFTKKGLRASSGRSLRDLRLYGHMFKQRCSYMIYSKSFRALPDLTKKMVYARLLEILSKENSPAPFDHLKKREQQRILEILRETLPDFPR